MAGGFYSSVREAETLRRSTEVLPAPFAVRLGVVNKGGKKVNIVWAYLDKVT